MTIRCLHTVPALLLLGLLGRSPCEAQELKPWALTLEGGVSDMHGETEAEGWGVAIRLSRRLMGYEWLRGDVAFTGGDADVDFYTAELGLEVRLCPTCRFTFFLGGGGGFLYEEGSDRHGRRTWNGGMLRGNAGFEVRIAQRFSARAMAQAGSHDGVRGPHLGMLGLAWRF